jgi:hypothetical protein
MTFNEVIALLVTFAGGVAMMMGGLVASGLNGGRRRDIAACWLLVAGVVMVLAVVAKVGWLSLKSGG